jgi:hypothetical protein
MLVVINRAIKSSSFNYIINTIINFDNVESLFIERTDISDKSYKYEFAVIAKTDTLDYELYRGNHLSDAEYIYNKLLEYWSNNKRLVHLDELLDRL